MFINNNSIVLSSKKEDVEITGYEFQKLPYSYDFLDPVIDAETMKIHHTKHQKKYFDKMMEVLDEKPNLMKKTIIELMSDLDKIPAKDREKFKNNAKVKIIQGDSSVVIGDLADKVNDSVFFWLDGHWSSGDTARGDLDCPLLEEVKQINNKYKNKCILAIDDVRLFGTYVTEDWSNITRDSVLNIVKDRLVSCDYFPSHLNSEDRMVLHLRDL